MVAATDTCYTTAANGVDGATLYDDVAAADIIAAADARTRAVTAGSERAAALNGECMARGHVDAGIVEIESPHSVRTLENDGGVAVASNARPIVTGVHTIDGHVFERHGGTVGDGNLYVLAERTGEYFALCLIVAGQLIQAALHRAAATVVRVVTAAAARAVVGILEDGPLRADVEVAVPLGHLEAEDFDFGSGLAADAGLTLDGGVYAVVAYLVAELGIDHHLRPDVERGSCHLLDDDIDAEVEADAADVAE